MKLGTEKLGELFKAAVLRVANHGPLVVGFFTTEERQSLADAFASAIGVADLLGRSRIRESWVEVMRAHGLPVKEEKASTPKPPDEALDYFTRLVPQLGLDPLRWGEALERQAFTLAVATENELIGKVQELITRRITSGKAFTTAPQDIQQLMDDAGVSSKNPQYAEAVMRSNVMDSYNTGATRELQDPEVIGTFPVYTYSNPSDSRSRPEHAARDGKHYPSSVPFVKVRGIEAKDAINCRCTFIPRDKWEWAKLKAGGARIAEGYPDVPATV